MRNNHATHPVCATHAAMRDSTWEGVWEPGSPFGWDSVGLDMSSQPAKRPYSLTHSLSVVISYAYGYGCYVRRVWSADLVLLLFSPGDVLSCEREALPERKGGRYLLPT